MLTSQGGASLPSEKEPALGAVRRRFVGPHRAVAAPPSPPRPGGAARWGRPRVPARRIFAGILYVFRSGCQWKAVLPQYASGIACHHPGRHRCPRLCGAHQAARSAGRRSPALTAQRTENPLTGDARERPCEPFTWLTRAPRDVQDAGSTIRYLDGTLSRYLPGCQSPRGLPPRHRELLLAPIVTEVCQR